MTLDLLARDVQGRLSEIGAADILVGVPSYNNAKTIERVMQAVDQGLVEYFPGARCVIAVCDGGSQDETRAIVERAALKTPIRLFVPLPPSPRTVASYQGAAAMGEAVRALLAIGAALQVQACAVIDADLLSITPGWMDLLIRPIRDERFEYVAPLSRRHKYDGSLSNSVVYPLTRALYGKRARQAPGGGYGVAGARAAAWSADTEWESGAVRQGLDIWMLTSALAEGARVCQAYLGPVLHESRDGKADLSAQVTRAVGAVFMLMERYQAEWQSVTASVPVPVFGPPFEMETAPVAINVARMVKAFKQGLRDLLPIWEVVLPYDTLSELLPLGGLETEEFRLPAPLWVQIVYDFALAYHERLLHREHLLKAMTPLYLGWTASFVLDTKDGGQAEVEQAVEALCATYEATKPYLLERWR